MKPLTRKYTKRQYDMLEVFKARPNDWLTFFEITGRQREDSPNDSKCLKQLVEWGRIAQRKSETRDNRDAKGRGSKPLEYKLATKNEHD